MNNEKNNIKDLLRSGNNDDIKLGALLAERKLMLDEIRYECENIDEWERKFNLPLVRAILQQFPMVHIAGSISLFLQGIRLQRWNQQNYISDVDVISPYYVNLQALKYGNCKLEDEQTLPSGGDFLSSLQLKKVAINNHVVSEEYVCKIDIGLSSTEKYKIVEYRGFKYNVGLVENILTAKIKYASKANDYKHKNDIYEMCGITAWNSYYEKNKSIIGENVESSKIYTPDELILF